MNLSCHCGAIKIEIDALPDSLTSCNCSTCHRYGALWGYFKPNEVAIETDTSVLSRYAWADENLYFCHCNKCGCVTHYETTEKTESSEIIALNFRMANPQAVQSITIRRFDGADTWKYLD